MLGCPKIQSIMHRHNFPGSCFKPHIPTQGFLSYILYGKLWGVCVAWHNSVAASRVKHSCSLVPLISYKSSSALLQLKFVCHTMVASCINFSLLHSLLYVHMQINGLILILHFTVLFVDINMSILHSLSNGHFCENSRKVMIGKYVTVRESLLIYNPGSVQSKPLNQTIEQIFHASSELHNRTVDGKSLST